MSAEQAKRWLVFGAGCAPIAFVVGFIAGSAIKAAMGIESFGFEIGGIGKADGAFAVAIVGAIWLLPAVSSFVAGVAWVRARNQQEDGQS